MVAFEHPDTGWAGSADEDRLGLDGPRYVGKARGRWYSPDAAAEVE